jgi:hypothetical protein
MVEKMIQIKGTIIRIMFSKLNNPFAELLSNVKTLKAITSNKKV